MKYIWYIAALLIMMSCSGGNTVTDSVRAGTEDTSKGKAPLREQMLTDSLNQYTAQYEQVQEQRDGVTAEFDALLTHFEMVQDPILVEPYRVVKGWKGYDTFSKPGILGRVLEDGRIEVVVTGVGDFDRVTLIASAASVQSGVVPVGNSLHTTADRYTRVAFNQAEPLCQFVYEHKSESISLVLSNGNKYPLSQAQKQMLAQVYEFSTLQQQLDALTAKENTLYNKIEYCKLQLEK